MGRDPKDGMRSGRIAGGRGSAGGLALVLLLAAPLMIAAKCSGDSAHPGEGDPPTSGSDDSTGAVASAPGATAGPSEGAASATTTTTADDPAALEGDTTGGSDAPVESGDPPSATESAGGSQPEDGGEPAEVASGGPPPLPKPIYKNVDEKCGDAPGVGDKAKPFTLKTPGGKELSLARYRKRVVLLNFWGTWCKPCLKELPEFDRLYRRYRKHGLTVIAVATDDDADKVQAFVKQRKLAAKVAIGGQELADAYGSPKFPFSFVIDPKGAIKAAYRGYEPGCLGKLEQDIRTQLEALRR